MCVCVCLRMCERECVCVPLGSDWSVFMLGWNSSWRHFAIYATTCIPSCLCFCWQGTATDAQEKQVYVPLLHLFSSVSSLGTKHVGYGGLLKAEPGDLSCFSMEDQRIQLKWCHHHSSYLLQCQFLQIQSFSKWLTDPWCKQHLLHLLGWSWGLSAKMVSFVYKAHS